MSDPVPVPVLAATVLIVRDGAAGLEVFMVKRHHQIDFAAGALVFPGGKADPQDCDLELEHYVDGIEGWSRERRILAFAAMREAFEEAGVLFARDSANNPVGEERLAKLQPYRERIEKGQTTLIEMLRGERLRLACDDLVPFAHWVTPASMPRRFDTHFFIVRTTPGQVGRHDGRESVDSAWLRPQDALADSARWKIIFPTKLNLLKLGRSMTAEDAIVAARASEPLRVEPWLEDGPEGKKLHIREDAGYEPTWVWLRDAF
ncbi:MAG TPA: hypothetical protein VGF97_12930 [Rhizomicrobium sp.]|jgi:8-oxo-dGTP pyrophosphatase MutT (NUDIX family)